MPTIRFFTVLEKVWQETKKWVFVLGVVLVSLTSAFADPQDKPAEPNKRPAPNEHLGYYAEGTLGTGAYFAGVFSSAGDHVSAGGVKGYGVTGAAGYNFTPVTALEGGMLWWHVGVNQNAVANQITANLYVPYITARFNVHIAERGALIFKTGVMLAALTGETNKDGTREKESGAIPLPFIGFGASYALTDKLELEMLYQGGAYVIVNAGVLSGGLVYHFD